MVSYHLCVAWNWTYDKDFIALLENCFSASHAQLLIVSPQNLFSTNSQIRDQQLSFLALLDRASDADPAFCLLVRWATLWHNFQINPFPLSHLATDKSVIHQLLYQAHLPVPQTIIIPTYDESPVIDTPDPSSLGPVFNLKPSSGSCSEGILLKINHLGQLDQVRKRYPQDKILLQSYIYPISTPKHPQAWFRAIYCLGHVHLCWWDAQTHLYTPVNPTDRDAYALDQLDLLVSQIATVVQLGLFSSEIALTDHGFVIIDYINDPLDLRPQSKYPDGVPDQILFQIATEITQKTTHL